jgi:hypothetical protein
MEKATEILKSLIPLVLIILFSWLFSLMSSKARKQAQEKAPEAKQGTGSPILDMLLNVGEGEEEPRPGVPLRNEASGSRMPLQPQAGGPQGIPGQPQITSKPITPKWWGA